MTDQTAQNDSPELSIKKVSKKKIIFVEIDEEITKIYEKIENLSYKDIYLVVPKRAVLLQSIVNLRILKQKLHEVGKIMSIVTEDANGMKLAQQAEIKVFDHWDESIVNAKDDQDFKKTSTMLRPIEASSNDIGDELPSRLPQKKSSIFEIVKNLRNDTNENRIKAYFKMPDFSRIKIGRSSLSGGAKRFLTFLFTASLSVFLIIIYVVLPGATLEIEPASDVVSRGVNIELGTPQANNPRRLKAYPVQSEVELTISHSASGAVNNGTSANGELTIYNTENRVWPLVAQTRFQTEDGIVFRLQEGVTVPAASGEIPGTLLVRVIADDLDANGIPSGERGNISPQRLFLPGLKEDSRNEIYAENINTFSGGESSITKIVTEEDLLAAQEKLSVQLKEKALISLRTEAEKEARSQGLTLKILEDSDVLKYENTLISLPLSLIGKEMESFEVSGTLKISGTAYDENALKAILKQGIVESVTPGKKLVKIAEDSISIQVLETSPLRFTAEIQGIEEYEIESEINEDSAIGEKIKSHISGKNIEEARAYIQNLPEVNKVSISVWPRWSSKIPSLSENIKIKSISQGKAIELPENSE